MIIFDCDGVLVDSEPISDRIFLQTLQEFGFSIPYHEAKMIFTGFSNRSCIEKIEKRFARVVPDEFLVTYNKRLFAELERSLKPIPGIREALDAIDAPVCVASSGDYEKMNVTLRMTGLVSRFDGKIFSAADVPRGKPFPDLFLHAAKTCNASAQRCAVVEDSVPGVLAGIAAQMTVFVYASGHDPSYYTELKQDIRKESVCFFYDMRELPCLLDNFGKSV